MPDREKVIKDLHDIAGFIAGRVGFEQARNFLRTIDDAIAMLKEQEEKMEHLNNIILEYEKEVFRLQAMLKEQEWHLLTEDNDGIIHGLPGDDGQYLMTDGGEIWIDDYIDGVDDGVWLDSGRDVREITAWMYTPELPKKDRR